MTSPKCQQCEDSDSVKHALAQCPAIQQTFEWMFSGLKKFDSSVTVDKLMLLDITPDNPLPFDVLPLVWFIAEVWRSMWSRRRDGKQVLLYHIRAELEAEVNLVRKSKYKDIAIILDIMMA